MLDRRAFLKGLGVLPAASILPLPNSWEGSAVMAPPRDCYQEIGVNPFINAAAAYSSLGGRNMWPEVVEAMEYGRKRNVIMKELQDAVGKHIATLLGYEAALVSAGATSAMTLGTAACLTGTMRI